MSTPTTCRARGLLRLGYNWNTDFVLEWNGQEEVIKEWNLDTPPPTYAEIDSAEEGGEEWERELEENLRIAKMEAVSKIAISAGLGSDEIKALFGDNS